MQLNFTNQFVELDLELDQVHKRPPETRRTAINRAASKFDHSNT